MPKRYISVAIQRKLDDLCKGYCEYCKCYEMYYPGGLSTDHIIPLYLGGSNELENLARTCDPCNESKHTFIVAIDPITNMSVPLFNPRKDNWDDHFRWSNDFLYMEGQTPIGRATIIRLNTNRFRTVNLRKKLIGDGHPPI